MPDPVEVQRRISLSRLPNSKLTVTDQEDLVRLEAKHGAEAAERFAELVAAELSKIGVDLSADFGYAQREAIAEKQADTPLPEADQIVPATYQRALYQVENGIIQVSGLVRQARARYDRLAGALDSLSSRWRDMSVETVEWKADAAAAERLADLKREVSLAKAHANFCDNCYEVVRSKIFSLNWMMQNYDRHHGVGPTSRSLNQGGAAENDELRDPYKTESL
jgi:hypothetical protein